MMRGEGRDARTVLTRTEAGVAHCRIEAEEDARGSAAGDGRAWPAHLGRKEDRHASGWEGSVAARGGGSRAAGRSRGSRVEGRGTACGSWTGLQPLGREPSSGPARSPARSLPRNTPTSASSFALAHAHAHAHALAHALALAHAPSPGAPAGTRGRQKDNHRSSTRDGPAGSGCVGASPAGIGSQRPRLWRPVSNDGAATCGEREREGERERGREGERSQGRAVIAAATAAVPEIGPDASAKNPLPPLTRREKPSSPAAAHHPAPTAPRSLVTPGAGTVTIARRSLTTRGVRGACVRRSAQTRAHAASHAACRLPSAVCRWSARPEPKLRSLQAPLTVSQVGDPGARALGQQVPALRCPFGLPCLAACRCLHQSPRCSAPHDLAAPPAPDPAPRAPAWNRSTFPVSRMPARPTVPRYGPGRELPQMRRPRWLPTIAPAGACHCGTLALHSAYAATPLSAEIPTS
ncbi:hypothetical protein B0J12DRAFT_763087 [Macrophomina phaseolina]|uniref:Uncharacterized protein n=1 Tax=Macrophomina phaseolina TaxID=35725 RepID=A0ABQ8GPM8_9PEZI|nr:hypothetical protein B0J12DRAFT_763087 [Macrophomina phaseolina]